MRRRWFAAALYAFPAALFATGSARAQAPPVVPTQNPDLPKPAPTGAKQSPVNPFPQGAGDAQNRGRAVNDVYWGILDGNVLSGVGASTATTPGAALVPNVVGNVVASRVPNVASAPVPLLELDGWGYPRGASLNGAFLLAPSVRYPTSLVQLQTGTTNLPAGAGTNVFVAATGPSTDTTFTTPAPTYFRAPAVARPNTAATAIAPNQQFTWDLRGLPLRNTVAGQQTLLQVQVYLPTPPDDDANVAANGGPENRVTDARYTVYFYLRDPVSGINYPKQKTFTVSQTGGGYTTLTNPDGNPAFFRFYSSQTNIAALPAQPGLGIPFQGVKLDNTTTDAGNNLYVVADVVSLVPSVDNVAATPVVTAPHGGRWHTNPNAPPTAAAPVAPPGPGTSIATGLPPAGTPADVPAGTRPKQPQPLQTGTVSTLFNPDYTADTTYPAIPFTNATTALGSYSRYFVNNPYDPIYGLVPADPARPVDVTVGFEPWNPSTLFRGPESLANPRLTGPQGGAQNTTQILPPGVLYPPPVVGPLVSDPTPPVYPLNTNVPPPGVPVGPTTPNRPQSFIYDPILVDPVTNLPNRTQIQTNAGAVTGTFITRPATAIDANNHDVYRLDRYRAYRPDITDPNNPNYNPAVPLFSQMQVLVPRTEYAPDPELGIPYDDKDGTLSIRVGAIYSLDWLTGALIWRFPDRSYVPGNARNPYITYSDGTSSPYAPNTLGKKIAGGLLGSSYTTTYDVNAASRDQQTNLPLSLIPGIAQVDKNSDGVFQDDEVFIVGQGTNTQAGLFSSITYVPQVAVRGNVTLPNYDFIPAGIPDANNITTPYARTRIRYQRTDTDPLAVRPSPVGRYSTADFKSVLVGVAYVAAENGVVYAIDPYGNNDNDYYPGLARLNDGSTDYSRTDPNTIDFRNFGTYRPGSTNVLWSFNIINTPQQRTETRQVYNTRLKSDAPATASFGASSPVIAYRRDEEDFNSVDTATNTYRVLDPITEEARLFVGNANSVLYAMDARADAGGQFDNMGNLTGVQPLPFRKESYRPVTGAAPGPGGTTIITYGTVGLKWWFETRGAINAPPAVSLMRENGGGANGGNARNSAIATTPATIDANIGNDPNKKGVFFTTQEGRAYGCDWDGPVTKANHDASIVFGTGLANAAADFEALATTLNDNFRFHNTNSTAALARADRLEGTIRPRWTFPGLYRDIDATDTRLDQIADTAQANAGIIQPAGPGGDVAGKRLGEPEVLGPINSAPVLIDFPWQDPLNLSNPPRHLSYIAFTAPDPAVNGVPATEGRFYLIDQVGDRVNFLNNPRVRGLGQPSRVFANPRDRFSPKLEISDASPVWTYRSVYDTYANLATTDTSTRVMDQRNSPLSVVGTAGAPGPRVPLDTTELTNIGLQVGVPGRKTVPTVYFAGPGRMFAVDFDEQTGLLLRYRPTIAETRAITALPAGTVADSTTVDDLYPGVEAERDLISPVDNLFTVGANVDLRARRIVARTFQLPAVPTPITHMTITAGPNRNRNTPIGYVDPKTGTTNPAPANPTVPAGSPPFVLPNSPGASGAQYVAFPTNDAPVLKPGQFTYDDPILRTLNAAALTQRFDPSGLNVNQDINDPLTTTDGVRSSLRQPLDPSGRGTQTPPVVDRTVNVAYQYPVLFVTDEDGTMYEVSSNIEGEDRSRITTESRTYTVGWSLFNFTDQIDFPITGGTLVHTIQSGPGGTSGVAVVSNTYFPSLNPDVRNDSTDPFFQSAPYFRPNGAMSFNALDAGSPPPYPNAAQATTQRPPYAVARARRQVEEATNPATPNRFRLFPYNEPNETSPTPVQSATTVGAITPIASNDDPRPDFKVRPYSPGVAGNPGPDLTFGTADDIVGQIPADKHSGQTGFPLDLNGKFFDKRYAGLRGATQTVVPNTSNDGYADFVNFLPITGQDPNADYAVKLRVPGYSYIGGNLDPADLTSIVTGSLAPTLLDLNNQLPDGARPLLPTGIQQVAGITATGNANTDDINPAAQNVAWLYAGGQGGVVYAFTPALPGQSSGGAAGTSVGFGGEGGNNGFGAPRVAIVDDATYNYIVGIGGATFPDDIRQRIQDGSLVRQGRRTFYEWGERINIIAFDVSAETGPRINGAGTGLVNSVYNAGGAPSVNIAIRSVTGSVRIYDRTADLLRNGNTPRFYYSEPGNSDSTRFGLAAVRVTVGNGVSAQTPWTPTDLAQVTANLNTSNAENGLRLNGRVVLNAGGGFGGTLDNDNYVSIANPLAVKGFAMNAYQGQGAQVVQAGVRTPDNRNTTNGIGPFHADSNSTPATTRSDAFPKDRVVDNLNVSGGPAQYNDDPDRYVAEYHQALTNGNTVQRRDLRRLSITGRRNPRFSQVLRQQGTGQDEPTFYFPVIASSHLIGHGRTGTTDVTPNQQNLRVLNRSLRARVDSVRVAPAESVFLWRSWPGLVPNAQADTPPTTFPTTNPAVNNGNPRLNPAVMPFTGEINRLPWEDAVTEAKPFNTAAYTAESTDYSNIPARGEVVRVTGSSGNYTGSTLPLPAAIDRTVTTARNLSLDGGNITSQANVARPTYPVPTQYATSANISVPKYQPANLVGLHNLTSTYIAPSFDDTQLDPTATDVAPTVGSPGPQQLPRSDIGIATRLLYPYNGDAIPTDGDSVVTPYGYTTRMLAMVDYDGTGRLTQPGVQLRNSGINPTSPTRSFTTSTGVAKAYREFELAFGIPIDMSAKVVESVVDVGKLSHGFGVQNSLLGYGVGPATYQPGFLPSPLFNATAFPNNYRTDANGNYVPNAPYNRFVKKFTVQNTGNTNLWNLRATQRTEVPGGAGYVPGSGFPFNYFGMRSTTVDPNFGVLAVGADPNANLPQANVMPQVITSLDKPYDAAWNDYVQTGPASPGFVGLPSALDPTISVYQAYYAQLGGRHTLHKALPNAPAPTVLGIPDVPSSKAIAATPPDAAGNRTPLEIPTNAIANTVVGIAVPLGTPSGIYDSTASATPFAVFEDHDTENAYQPVPAVSNMAGNGASRRPVLTPAGPLYNRTDLVHPGTNPIRTAGAGTGEGTWRPRREVTVTIGGVPQTRYEYLPFTQNFVLKAQVTEANLTGLVPDRGIDTADAPGSVVTGLLPSIDPFPLIDRTTFNATGLLRPAAALGPAAYRSADGRLHVIYARNGRGDAGLGDGFAQPGQGFQLYHSTLNWNNNLGTWTAAQAAVPLANTDASTGATNPSALNNTGRWFADGNPVLIDPNPTATDNKYQSNTQPFVLETYGNLTNAIPAGAPTGATLFFVNTVPVQNGTPVSQIMYTRLDATTGDPVAGGQPFLSAYDPSIQRFGPRAVYDSNSDSTVVLYYGGTTGRFTLYYSARTAGADGTPTGASAPPSRRREIPLPIPSAFSTVSDPAPVLRDLTVFRDNRYQNIRAVDVYYTGVSRATQAPDVYMTRYQIIPANGRNVAATLQPLTLPRVIREKLSSPGRLPVWQGRHIAWARDLASRPDLPVVYVGTNPNTPNLATALTAANRWLYDANTGVLFQVVNGGTPGKETYVYVDTAAGTIRFRGPLTPLKTQYVFADYQPQTYRITANGASNLSPFSFNENRLVAASSGTNIALRRPNIMNVGRQWTFWQKTAQGSTPATLFYAPRRVGIDLKSFSNVRLDGASPALGANDSIQLSERDGTTNNQFPLIQSVQVGTRITGAAGYPNVALNNAQTVNNYEVDFATGKIYLEPQYEGLDIDVTFVPASAGLNGGGVTARGRLTYVEELNTNSGVTGLQVPMNNPVNEAQPYAFFDRFNQGLAAGGGRPNSNPNPASDPALSPYRVWLFWSSPRGRLGTQLSAFNGQPIDAFPGGYDLYWQALAPAFETQTFSGQPQ